MTGSGQAGLRRRLGALRAADVRRLDAAAADAGIAVETLMETAGWQLARTAWRLLGHAPGDVLVCAGRGNNGGDSLVVARLLATWGCAVTVAMVLGNGVPSALVMEQRRRLTTAGGRAGAPAVFELHHAAEMGGLLDAVGRAELVVDGLLGSGLQGPPRPLDTAAIGALGHPRILSVDVPSGLDVDTGSAAGACVRAHTTCTLTAMKQGLWAAAARAFTGELVVADIGMPAAAWRAAGLDPPRAVRAGALLRVTVPSD